MVTEKELGVVEQYLNDFMPNVLSFLIQLIIAVLVLVVGSRLIKWVQKILKKSMEKHSVDPGVMTFLLSLIKYALYFVLILVILSTFGITTGSVVAVLGSAGLTVGLALQGSLQNFAGGVLLLVLKPFQVGDYIIDNGSGMEGKVDSITIYYTRLVTIDNQVIMIPNGSLTTNSIVNVTKMDKRRVNLTVGVSYGSNLEQVKKVLTSVIEEEPLWLKEEPSNVYVSELGDSSVIMGVFLWVKAENYWEVKWRMTENIKLALDANDISIPFPQLEVQIQGK